MEEKLNQISYVNLTVSNTYELFLKSYLHYRELELFCYALQYGILNFIFISPDADVLSLVGWYFTVHHCTRTRILSLH
jgi:hypothetical protein